MLIPLFSPCLVFGIQKDPSGTVGFGSVKGIIRQLEGSEGQHTPRDAVYVEHWVSVIRCQDPSLSKW